MLQNVLRRVVLVQPLILAIALLAVPGALRGLAGPLAYPQEQQVQEDDKEKSKEEKQQAKEQEKLEKQRQKEEKQKAKNQNKTNVKATLIEPEPKSEPAPEPAATPTTSTATTPTVGTTETPNTPSSPQDVSTAPTPATSSVGDRDPSLSETIDVIEVQLDVLVHGPGGELVEGLGPEDFIVLEEGKEREVTSAFFYGGLEELTAPGGDEGGTRSDRYFVFLFQDQSRNLPSLMRYQMDAGRMAQRWVETQMLPNDQVAVLAYDVKLKIYQDFTRDKELLIPAMQKASVSGKEPDRTPGRSTEVPVQSADSPSLLLNLPAGKELRKETAIFQQTLGLLGRAMEGIIGRKNLLLFSVGYGDTRPGTAVWQPDPRYYYDMEKSLNAGNVAVYGIYTLGRVPGSSTSGGLSNSLNALSADTDGLFYPTFTNFLTPMQQVSKDNLGYYLLSYRSEYPAGTSGYRTVRVKTREKGFKVRYRRGYGYGEKQNRRWESE